MYDLSDYSVLTVTCHNLLYIVPNEPKRIVYDCFVSNHKDEDKEEDKNTYIIVVYAMPSDHSEQAIESLFDNQSLSTQLSHHLIWWNQRIGINRIEVFEYCHPLLQFDITLLYIDYIQVRPTLRTLEFLWNQYIRLIDPNESEIVKQQIRTYFEVESFYTGLQRALYEYMLKKYIPLAIGDTRNYDLEISVILDFL